LANTQTVRGTVKLINQLAYSSVEAMAFSSEQQGARTALEQGMSEVGLERLDLLAHCRLRQSQLLGRALVKLRWRAAASNPVRRLSGGSLRFRSGIPVSRASPEQDSFVRGRMSAVGVSARLGRSCRECSR
jgi:hypothetical protein